MLAFAPVLQDARSHLSIYKKRSEELPEPLPEPQRFNLEAALAEGMLVYNLINRIDELWRGAVYRQPDLYDPMLDESVEGMYRTWAEASESLRNHAMLKAEAVIGASEFLSACREVKGILTPDDEFFTGDRLVELRDAAVDEHYQGRTEPLQGVPH